VELSDGSRVVSVITPIRNEATCSTADCHAHAEDPAVLGFLQADYSLKRVDALTAARNLQTLVAALTAIAVCILGTWLMIGPLLDRPISTLIAGMKTLAAGDLSFRFNVRRNDEFAIVAESFNDMVQKLYEAQRQLLQANKLASVGSLAAGVAHEINNPLTGVLTYSSFLLKRADKDPELREDLEVIVRETKRCREIVKDAPSVLDSLCQDCREKQ